MDAPEAFGIRLAGLDDIDVLVRHRCEMFRDMRSLRDDAYPELAAATAAYYRWAIPAGEYVGWVVYAALDPDTVVGGGGLQLRRILPRPSSDGSMLPEGPQGLIVNVFTEHAWRRKGLAELVMHEIIRWCRENGVTSLVLRASEQGKALYERLGFRLINEMEYPSAWLAKPNPPQEDNV